MSHRDRAVKSVIMIMFFTLGSKVLGFVRDALIAAKFGSGVETDTFFLALTAVTLFVTMIVRAVNTTVLPILDEIEKKEGKIKKILHTNNILNILLLIALFITIIAMISAPLIIKMLAVGFKGQQFDQAVMLMRLGLPVVLFSSLVGVFRSYLQSELMFRETAMTQIPYNMSYILFLVFFSSFYGIKGLMITSIIAVAAQLCIQIPGMLKTGYKYKPVFNIKNQYIKKILVLSIPVLFSAVINDINKIVDKSLASKLISGSISALDYADRIQQLIYGVFIMAITTVIYPLLSEQASSKNIEGLKNVLRKGFNIILIITIPATIGMIILAKPIVSIAFERGAFTKVATNMAASALVFYTIGLAGMSVRTLLYRVYYSLQDTKTPLINSIIAVAINIILNLIFINFMGHNGLALATSIAATTTAILLLYNLKKKLGKLEVSNLVKCGVKSLIAAVLMGITVLLCQNILGGILTGTFMKELLLLLILISIGTVTYIILIYALRVEEFKLLLNMVMDKVKKNR